MNGTSILTAMLSGTPAMASIAWSIIGTHMVINRITQWAGRNRPTSEE